MASYAAEDQSDLEKSTNDYLSRIRQIDTILEPAVLTLIALGTRQEDSAGKRSVSFPALIAESGEFEQPDTLLAKSVCFATLQRLWRLRRRFPWLKGKSRKELETLQPWLGESYTPTPSKDFKSYLELLRSDTFGWLNPLTASQVAHVLLESEDFAHRGMGFLTFFSMVWSLCRRYPDSMRIGARIEPWEPTAYVTAKCLMPLKILQNTVQRRAELCKEISRNLQHIEKHSKETSHRGKWLFNAGLDQLAVNLRLIAGFSVDRKAFETSAKEVAELSQRAPTVNETITDNKQAFQAVLDSLKEAFVKIGLKSAEVLAEADCVVKGIDSEILRPLQRIDTRWDDVRWKRRGPDSPDLIMLKKWGLKFPKEYENDHAYWADVRKAADDSYKLCRAVLQELEKTQEVCKQLNQESAEVVTFAALTQTISIVAEANIAISRQMDEHLLYAARWCRAVVDREIAHASAENITDFEPSELVSAIAVAVRWDLMTTPLQVSEAVTRAIHGARKDGSWRAGQPFYAPDDTMGIWSGTSETVWALTSAIGQYPDVDQADDALFRFVHWLERRQITLRRNPGLESVPKLAQSGAPIVSAKDRYKFVGWPSERLRHRRKIHMVTTACSINALLEIRDLIEYRLWQLCRKRFSVVTVDKSLAEIDPVDLGLKHSERLHTQLARMASDAQEPDNEDAIYSLVLHGPPGSSKTSVAEALSSEMWKASSRWGGRRPRLLRITPADFTRLGEGRIDSEARLIFNLIAGIRGATILFDEIDDLLRERDPENPRLKFMDLVVPAMLNRIADLRKVCPRQEVSFIIATNFVEKIEPALIRKGRIDTSIAVVYPDWESRLAMIDQALSGISIDRSSHNHDRCERIAKRTAQWPYLTIKAALQDIARKLRTEPGTGDTLESLLDNILLEHESRFFRPVYANRWNAMKRLSQELLSEHVQHLLSVSNLSEPHPLGKLYIFEDPTRERILRLLAGVDPAVKQMSPTIDKSVRGRLAQIVDLIRARREP